MENGRDGKEIGAENMGWRATRREREGERGKGEREVDWGGRE